MKKLLISGFIAILLSLTSCGNNEAEQNTHTHEDGSTHADHDTTKPAQEEFNIADTTTKDTTNKDTIKKKHTHKYGKAHSH
jgi:hypothetical protein